MSKNIRIEDIEESQWIYLQYLIELEIRLIMYELQLLRLDPQLENYRAIEDYSDDENWYSD